MLPVIAIVGRPNVGKSTLFNQLTKTRASLVADIPGVTRDRIYGEAEVQAKKFIVIDTGGMQDGTDMDKIMGQQAELAINEAQLIIFLVDAQTGITASDEIIAKKLRKTKKPIYLTVNKLDGLNADIAQADFYALGLGKLFPIAALKGQGVKGLASEIVANFAEVVTESQEQGIKIAFIGRPNAGKSTLINRILKEDRVLVYDQPGTTRDSIYIPFNRRNKNYTLIDTAGIRRRSKVTALIEKYSVVKSLQAIDAANVVVIVIDAQEGIAEHDLRLIGFVLEAGRSLVIAINKWDGLLKEQREQIHKEIDRRLRFVDFAKIHFISALHGSGVGNIFSSINKAYFAATKKLITSRLTQMLLDAVAKHTPPMVRGRRIKIRYAHCGGHNPPQIIIYGSRVSSLPKSYKSYLMNFFRKALKLEGTPIIIQCHDN